MSLIITGIIIVGLGAAAYIYRKVVVAKAEAEFNTAHAWVIANGAVYAHRVVNELEHVWTVAKGDLQGIGRSLHAAVENLKSKL